MNSVPSLYNNNLLQLHHATQKQTPEDLNTLHTTLTVNIDSYVSQLVSYFKRLLECFI